MNGDSARINEAENVIQHKHGASFRKQVEHLGVRHGSLFVVHLVGVSLSCSQLCIISCRIPTSSAPVTITTMVPFSPAG